MSDLYWGIGILVIGLLAIIFKEKISSLGDDNNALYYTKKQSKNRTIIIGIILIFGGLIVVINFLSSLFFK